MKCTCMADLHATIMSKPDPLTRYYQPVDTNRTMYSFSTAPDLCLRRQVLLRVLIQWEKSCCPTTDFLTKFLFLGFGL